MGWRWAAACGVQGGGILRGFRFPHSLFKKKNRRRRRKKKKKMMKKNVVVFTCLDV